MFSYLFRILITIVEDYCFFSFLVIIFGNSLYCDCQFLTLSSAYAFENDKIKFHFFFRFSHSNPLHQNNKFQIISIAFRTLHTFVLLLITTHVFLNSFFSYQIHSIDIHVNWFLFQAYALLLCIGSPYFVTYVTALDTHSIQLTRTDCARSLGYSFLLFFFSSRTQPRRQSHTSRKRNSNFKQTKSLKPNKYLIYQRKSFHFVSSLKPHRKKNRFDDFLIVIFIAKTLLLLYSWWFYVCIMFI